MTVDFKFNLQQRVNVVETPATGTVIGLMVDENRIRRVRVYLVTTEGENIWPWYREDQLKAAPAPVATEATARETGANHGQ